MATEKTIEKGELLEDSSSTRQLTKEQRERIEKNRNKARALRKERLASTPYDKPPGHSTPKTKSHQNKASRDVAFVHTPTKTHSVSSTRNTYGGYMLDDDQSEQKRHFKVVEEEAPPLPNEQFLCEECGRRFSLSFLCSKFKLEVCDQCRVPDGKHALITKTEAKQRYLLKDCDFEERDGPPLSFILKRNPHTSGWGEMKLYLVCQVEGRSHDIWGGEAGLQEEHQRKSERREKKKERKYAKEIKELRRAVRSSMSQKSTQSHEHTFPSDKEVYDSESDTWTKTCSICGYEITFEKM